MADYWPAAATNPSTSKSDLEIADKMNNLPKIVFSKTLQEVKWNNSRLVKEKHCGRNLENEAAAR